MYKYDYIVRLYKQRVKISYTDLENIFATCITNKGLVFKIYKEFSQINFKKEQPWPGASVAWHIVPYTKKLWV